MQLFGWDTIYLAQIDLVNAALASRSDTLIKALDFSVAMPGGPIPVHMDLGTWQVVPGGSGNLLWLSVAVPAGTMTVPPSTVVDLAGVSLVFEVSLQLLPAQVGPSPLAFAFDTAGTVGSPGGPGIVTPMQMGNAGQLDTATQTLLLNGAASCLVQLAGELSFVFASVNLMPPGTGNWLTPVEARYGYVPVGGSSTAYLTIFASMSERDVSGLSLSVDPELVSRVLPTGAFAISQDLFLENVIQPQLPGTFGGNPASYSYDGTQHALVNAGNVSMPDVKVGAIWYTPVIESLLVTTDNQGLAISVKGSCDLKANISMTFQVTSRNALVFDPGTQTISFSGDPSPTEHHDADIPWYWEFLSPIVGIITGIVVKVISDDLADNLNQHLSGAKFLATPALAVTWTDAAPFVATTAGIDQGYYVRGQL